MSLVKLATDFFWHGAEPAFITPYWKFPNSPAVIWGNLVRDIGSVIGSYISSDALIPALRSFDPNFPLDDPDGGAGTYGIAGALLKASNHDVSTPGAMHSPLSQDMVLRSDTGTYVRQARMPIDGDNLFESYELNAARWSLYASKVDSTASEGPFRFDDVSPCSIDGSSAARNGILGNLFQVRMISLKTTGKKLARALGKIRPPTVSVARHANASEQWYVVTWIWVNGSWVKTGQARADTQSAAEQTVAIAGSGREAPGWRYVAAWSWTPPSTWKSGRYRIYWA